MYKSILTIRGTTEKERETEGFGTKEGQSLQIRDNWVLWGNGGHRDRKAQRAINTLSGVVTLPHSLP